jgi:hypothetical protein
MTGIGEAITAVKTGWSAVAALLDYLRAGRIEITSPRPQEPLSDPKTPAGGSTSYAVRGKLKRLPLGHRIWLLVEDEKIKKVWPQGFAPVQYDPKSGEWTGRVMGKGNIRILAVVAPPTSQQLFGYYQSIGDKTKNFEPLDNVPVECMKMTSVQTSVP